MKVFVPLSMREFKRELADAILSTPDTHFNIICTGGLKQFIQLVNDPLKEKDKIPWPISAIELSEHPKFMNVILYWLNLSTTAVRRDIRNKIPWNCLRIYDNYEGFIELDNGMQLLSLSSSIVKVFEPVYFVIYWDGCSFRGYVPKKGNSFNLSTRDAFEKSGKKIIEPEKDKFYNDVKKTFRSNP